MSRDDQVEPARAPCPPGQGERDARQRGAGAAAGDAHQQQVAAVEVPAHRDPAAAGRGRRRAPTCDRSGRPRPPTERSSSPPLVGRGQREVLLTSRATPVAAPRTRRRRWPPRPASIRRSRSVGASSSIGRPRSLGRLEHLPPKPDRVGVDERGGTRTPKRPVTSAVCTGGDVVLAELHEGTTHSGTADRGGPAADHHVDRVVAASCTRSATRRLVLARMSSLTTPAGRCVARIMWTPRVRPTQRPRSTSEDSTSGYSLGPAWRTRRPTRSSRGIGLSGVGREVGVEVVDPLAGLREPPVAGSPSRPRAPAVPGRPAARRGCSPCRWCAAAARRSRRAPTLEVDEDEGEPVSGRCARRGRRPSERRNSLLPEPVVPPTRPCGPSRTRSILVVAAPRPRRRGVEIRVGGRAPALADRLGRRCPPARAAARGGPSPGSAAPGDDPARGRRSGRGRWRTGGRCRCRARQGSRPSTDGRGTRRASHGAARVGLPIPEPRWCTRPAVAPRWPRATMPATWVPPLRVDRPRRSARPRPSRLAGGRVAALGQHVGVEHDQHRRPAVGAAAVPQPARAAPRCARAGPTATGRRPLALAARRAGATSPIPTPPRDRSSQKTPTVRSAGPAGPRPGRPGCAPRPARPRGSPTIPTTPPLVSSTSTGAARMRVSATTSRTFLPPAWRPGLGVERSPCPPDVAHACVEPQQLTGTGVALPQLCGREGSATQYRGGVRHLVAASVDRSAVAASSRSSEEYLERPRRTARPPPRGRTCGGASAPTRCRPRCTGLISAITAIRGRPSSSPSRPRAAAAPRRWPC